MGCTQSKIENDEAVSRCKDRRLQMSQAVSNRNKFAAAHSAYAMALKNTGGALNGYCQGEVQDPRLPAGVLFAATPQPPLEKLLPPPPPPDSDRSNSSLPRSASMPGIHIPLHKKLPADSVIREEEADALNDEPSPSRPPSPLLRQPSLAPTPPPPMPEPRGMEGSWDYFFELDPNMPGPSLSQPEPEEILPEKRKDFADERLRKQTAAAPPSISSDDVDEMRVTPEKVVPEPAPLLPPKATKKQRPGGMVHHQHAASTGGGPSDSKRGKIGRPASGILVQILNELDDYFLKASESAHMVSKMLEATRMHYHSNFADSRGHIDHSAKVMQVITWNRSIKGFPTADDGKDDFDDDKWETHATVLDKMLAWEKKLYDEVKAGELMKTEYQRKVALLNKQTKRGTNPEALEKSKAAVSHLHTRYIVDMQSMDSTVSEINSLRDDRLYPKLVHLVDGMANMWETMSKHHASQSQIVARLATLEISDSPKETSEEHHRQTVQLGEVVEKWHLQFKLLVKHQREYIQALNNWLKLNLIPIESSLKEKVSSPPMVRKPPIQTLLDAWHDQLGKLQDELAESAIGSFSEAIKTIRMDQLNELKLKEKCEEINKDYLRKTRAFEDWYHKYSEKKAALSEGVESSEGSQDPVTEKRLVVDALKTKLDTQMNAYHESCRQVRGKSLESLKTHLPELFRAMSEFSSVCSEMYKKLRSLTQPAESGE